MLSCVARFILELHVEPKFSSVPLQFQSPRPSFLLRARKHLVSRRHVRAHPQRRYPRCYGGHDTFLNPLVSTNWLGFLVRIEAVLALKFLDELDVLILGGGGGRAGVDFLLPCLVFGFALLQRV